MTPAKPKTAADAQAGDGSGSKRSARGRAAGAASLAAASGGFDAAGPRTTGAALDRMRLTADRLLVRLPDDGERRSKAGLLIPATAVPGHKRCIWSDVVLVGPDARGVRAGDLVLFVPQTGLEVDVEGDTYLLLRERDVQAVASERVDPHAGQYL